MITNKDYNIFIHFKNSISCFKVPLISYILLAIFPIVFEYLFGDLTITFFAIFVALGLSLPIFLFTLEYFTNYKKNHDYLINSDSSDLKPVYFSIKYYTNIYNIVNNNDYDAFPLKHNLFSELNIYLPQNKTKTLLEQIYNNKRIQMLNVEYDNLDENMNNLKLKDLQDVIISKQTEILIDILNTDFYREDIKLVSDFDLEFSLDKLVTQSLLEDNKVNGRLSPKLLVSSLRNLGKDSYMDNEDKDRILSI